MTTVRNILVDEEATPLPNIRTEVVLLRPGEITNAFNQDKSQIVSRVITFTDSDGQWGLDLIPNSMVTPANTYYQVAHYIVGEPNQISTFRVPATGGPYMLEDLLIVPPETIPLGIPASQVSFDPGDSGMESTNAQDAILEANENGSGGGDGSEFPWYQDAELVDDVVVITFNTPFGIDEGTGIPYFDPDNVTEGEEAVLLEDLSLVQPGR